ncbi:asparagine synthase-related protein [Paraliobacillus zengyii]|uniref:asparagine synthase-related protein n=1 Tax=Paraliobacillus zengyii TaxID=2213194 RepID=UPI000E3ECB99|nr:asparagine synthase-related protein [Paraliobacillus zengyii]
MSAIAGIYHLNKQPVSSEASSGMMDNLSQFPADDVSIWQKENVFLGCHAQWITPESVGEVLPYYNPERQLAITADAIIDNRAELFESLQVDKAKRKGMPDSQLILLAYCKWGEDAPKYLIGDFAFMIWDEREQKLFGARDPSGYRTLYYYLNQSNFSFCTTIEPLLELSFTRKKLNEAWLAEFLAISGMIDTVDARMTPYLGLEQIPPFHSFSLVKGEIELKKYGSFYPKEALKLDSNEAYVAAFQEVYQRAVNDRLRTYRNVGSQLSGGLDSGSVVGFAVKELKKKDKMLYTFSYVPPSDFVDYTPRHQFPNERPAVKKTVEYVGGIDDYYADFEGRSSFTEIDTYLDVMEMPYKFLENSFWLSGIFEKAQEKDVGILLNGDRGNFTVSWGTPIDHYAVLLKKFKWIRFYQELKSYSEKLGTARSYLFPVIAKTAFPFHKRKTAGTKLINSEFADKIGVFQKLKEHGIDDSGWFGTPNIYQQRQILFEDILPWNAGNTLDCKLSLRYSLWKRDPTNDIRVVRFCLSLPEEQYTQNGLDRALIRRSTAKILPDSIRLNQRTRGVQAADWIHRMIPDWDSFVNEAKKLTTDPSFLAFINGELLAKAIAKAEEGPQQEYRGFDYSLLMRCLIVNRFITKNF